MKIKLSEDTANSVRGYKMWDPLRSHDFVSTHQLNQNIASSVRGILDSQLTLNDNRNKSIFCLTGCVGYIDKLYESTIQHPTMSIDQKLSSISDSMEIIQDDLNSRIMLYHKYKGNPDFRITNDETLRIMKTIALGRNNDLRLTTFDTELASLFQVTSEPSKFKMDKMQHICSAMSSLFWELYSSGDYVEEIRLSEFLSDLIFDIEGVFPNVLKDENSDLFWAFTEAVEDVMGFSYKSVNYYVDENDVSRIDKLDLLITRMYQFLRNVIMYDRCDGVYQKSFQIFNEIRGEILTELGLTSPGFVADDSNSGVIKDYGELLYNVAISLMSEALEQIWSLYINSNGETDCFTGTICRKITLITLYLMTNDLTYLNYIAEVNI